MNPLDRPLRVQFIHGLEGSPQGTKARFLAARFDAITPTMDTSDFPSCVSLQAEELVRFAPDVVVGSSYGGAVLVTLLDRALWRGPTVLLAPAAAKLGPVNALPEGVAVTIAHGIHDEVIPLEDSRALAATGTPALVRLIEYNDDHRLQTLVDDGTLAELVESTWRRASEAPR